MQKTDFHVLELFCRASHVRASMHRITNLELLRTLMLCLVQLSKWKNARSRMLKSFFLSERKLLNAILWIKLKYMKDVSFSWNEMLFSIQRITNLELLRTLMLCLVQLSKLRECKATDAEKLLSQWEKVAKCNFKSNALARPRMLKSFFLSELKLLTAIIRVKYMKDVFSHEMKCYCNAEDRFSCVRAFLQSKSY